MATLEFETKTEPLEKELAELVVLSRLVGRRLDATAAMVEFAGAAALEFAPSATLEC